MSLLRFHTGAALQINLAIVQFGVKDTLPESRRKPFAWRAANPLAFVTLFRRGAKLRRLCLFSVLSSLERNNRSLQSIYQMQILGWGILERGRFTSASALLSLPGFAASPALISALGLRHTVRLGVTSTVLQSLCNGFATQSWHMYLAALVGVGTMAKDGALTALVSEEGRLSGLSLGEL